VTFDPEKVSYAAPASIYFSSCTIRRRLNRQGLDWGNAVSHRYFSFTHRSRESGSTGCDLRGFEASHQFAKADCDTGRSRQAPFGGGPRSITRSIWEEGAALSPWPHLKAWAQRRGVPTAAPPANSHLIA